jgi:hypothetical protein
MPALPNDKTRAPSPTLQPNSFLTDHPFVMQYFPRRKEPHSLACASARERRCAAQAIHSNNHHKVGCSWFARPEGVLFTGVAGPTTQPRFTPMNRTPSGRQTGEPTVSQVGSNGFWLLPPILMETLRGFPNLPALWLRRAKLAFAYAFLMGTFKGLPNPRPLPATLPTARFARPRALWLRRAKLAFAYAVMGTKACLNPPALWPRRAKLAFAYVGPSLSQGRAHGC